MKRMSQTEQLLQHFNRLSASREIPSITGIEASALFKIRSLSRRINDLEAKGFSFTRLHKVDTTGQRYVRYVFEG